MISGGAAGRVTCGCCWCGDEWAGQCCGAGCLLCAPLRCSWLRTTIWRDGRLRRLGRCEAREQSGHVRAKAPHGPCQRRRGRLAEAAIGECGVPRSTVRMWSVAVRCRSARRRNVSVRNSRSRPVRTHPTRTARRESEGRNGRLHEQSLFGRSCRPVDSRMILQARRRVPDEPRASRQSRQ
jgi:hypothetical protein